MSLHKMCSDCRAPAVQITTADGGRRYWCAWHRRCSVCVKRRAVYCDTVGETWTCALHKDIIPGPKCYPKPGVLGVPS